MGNGISLGHLFGINIRIDWSWLLIFVLIVWNLAAGFGAVHPDWGLALAFLTAVVAALLFFASVLAHELVHSLVARGQGVPVRDITLFLFGGVSNIQRNPPSPRAEFAITVVGPLTSFVIGFVLLAAVNAAFDPVADFEDPEELAAQLGPVETLAGWLGSVNILLVVFNLVPGFPLDGGRILRSILWAITNDLRRATRWATGVGQAVAWLMIIGGLASMFGLNVPLIGRGLINGLWLVFIGWFLNNAAIQSYQRVVIQEMLEGIPVARLMRRDPPLVPAKIPVANVVDDYVMRTDDYAFPVVDGTRLVGLVTMDDVRSVGRDNWDQKTVDEIMTPVNELVTVEPQADAGAALNKLLARDVRQLPVLQNGHLVGLLRRNDIVKWLHLHAD